MPQIELYKPGQVPFDAEQQRRRQSEFTAFQPVKPVQPGDVLPLVGLLGAGSYRGAKLTGTMDLTGVGPTLVTSACDFAGQGKIRGLTFQDTVTLRATADVEFTGCTFLLPITVVAGGRVVVAGSRFDGTSAIANAGAPGDAFRTGCIATSLLAADANLTISGGD
tara:strand:+ start:266 stop:760 length:495 start_codon:yes stop_codon:yes gene_type:complete